MKLRRRNGLGAVTQAALQTQANAAVHEAAIAGGIASIVDNGGVVSVVSSLMPSGISQQAQLSQPLTAAEQTDANNLASDAFAVQTMHTNASLSSNTTPYLAPGVKDGGAVGAPPTYIALPTYPRAKGSQNPGTFPYQNPAPHWTANLKWWTGQTLLNVGTPKYSNDPWEYLRSALVDSNMAMLKNWIVWFLAEVGKPASTVWANSQPWAQALAALNLSSVKYIATSEGAVFLPFSYADLTAIQQTTASYEYGYNPATLATYLATWVSQVLPDVTQFPLSERLNPSGVSPYGANYLPAMYRIGSTFFSQLAPYLPVLTIAVAGALGVLLAVGSGVGAAAAPAAEATDAGTAAATDALTAGADASLTAGDILPEVTVTAATSTGIDVGATTALTAAAAGGATLPTLDEVTVTPNAPANPDLSLPSTDLSAAAASAATNQVNYPTQQNSGPSTSQETSAASALAKLLTGGSSAPTSGGSGASDDGVTGAASETLGDWLSDLTSSDWILILALGATGLYFVHRSRPHRKAVNA